MELLERGSNGNVITEVWVIERVNMKIYKPANPSNFCIQSLLECAKKDICSDENQNEWMIYLSNPKCCECTNTLYYFNRHNHQYYKPNEQKTTKSLLASVSKGNQYPSKYFC